MESFLPFMSFKSCGVAPLDPVGSLKMVVSFVRMGFVHVWEGVVFVSCHSSGQSPLRYFKLNG